MNEKEVKIEKYRNSHFLGFAYYYPSANGEWRLKIRWKRIFILLAFLAVLGYFALVSMFFVRERYLSGNKLVSFSDVILFPISRSARVDFREKIGEEYAKKIEFSKDFMELFNNARRTLAYSPYNLKSRMIISYFLFAQNQPKDALKFLRDALPHSDSNLEYCLFFISQASKTGEDLYLIDVANDILLEKEKYSKDFLEMIGAGAVLAAIERTKFDEAKKLIKAFNFENTLNGVFFDLQQRWYLGQKEEAISLLKGISDVNTDPTLVLMLALYQKNVGENNLAAITFYKLFLMTKEYEIRIKSLMALKQIVTTDVYKEYEEIYLKEYKQSTPALVLFLQFAINNKEWGLVERVYKMGLENKVSDFLKIKMLYIESLILSGNLNSAKTEIDELSKGNFARVQGYQGVLDCLKSLLYYKEENDNAGKILWEQVLRAGYLSNVRWGIMGDRFKDLGLTENMIAAYEKMINTANKNNEYALRKILEVAIQLKDRRLITTYLPDYLESRHPLKSLILDIRDFLGQDSFIYVENRDDILKKIDEALAKPGFLQTKELENKPVYEWF